MSDIQALADNFLGLLACIGLASRHTTPEATGMAATYLYVHMLRVLPPLIRQAIAQLEVQLEPHLLASLIGPVPDGKSAALCMAEALFQKPYPDTTPPSKTP